MSPAPREGAPRAASATLREWSRILREALRAAARDPALRREIVPLAFVVLLAPWFYLAIDNYGSGAVFRDVNMFSYAAFCLRKGERLYDTIATPDGPVIYWLQAFFQLFSGTNDQTLRKVDLVFHASVGATLACLIVPRANAWRWTRRIVWAVFGAALWLGWVLQSDFSASLQREAYYVALGSLGFALVYASAGRAPALARWMLVMGGFLAGLQMFGKHTGLLYAGLAVLTSMLLPRDERRSWRFDVGWTCAGVLGAVAFVFVYLAAFGSIRGFFFWYLEYDLGAYRFFAIYNVADMLAGPRTEIYGQAVGVLCVGSVAIAAGALPRRALAFALAPVLNSVANIVQLHGWHYQIVPAIASTYLFYLYALAMAWASPHPRMGPTRQIAAVGVAALVLPLCAKQIMNTPWLHPAEKHLTAPEVVQPREAGDYLAVHTRSTDRVLYYGGNPVAPFVAQRRPAIPYMVVWMVDLSRSMLDQPDLDVSHRPTPKQREHMLAMQKEIQTDACRRVLQDPPPAMIFDHAVGYPSDPVGSFVSFCPALSPLLKQRYRAGAIIGDAHFYLRNDRD